MSRNHEKGGPPCGRSAFSAQENIRTDPACDLVSEVCTRQILVELMQQAVSHRVARPYTELAAMYDATLGVPFFVGARKAFEEIIKRYGINFRSAADIGCGTGLFARYLSRRWGVPTLAVDRSPAMLAIAMRNCTGCKVGLLQQDIRCLQLPQPVDLVTANFDTLNYLLNGLDLRQTFRRIYVNVRPGGYFIFDLITPCQHRGAAPGSNEASSEEPLLNLGSRSSGTACAVCFLRPLSFKNRACSGWSRNATLNALTVPCK